MYNFEHRLLPAFFYNNTKGFVEGIKEKPEILYNILKDVFSGSRQPITFKKEDFKVEEVDIDDKDTTVLKVFFPQIKDNGALCKYVYLFYSKDYKDMRYFTVEAQDHDFTISTCKSMGLPIPPLSDNPMLCSWYNGNHHNYGAHPEEEILEKCEEIFFADDEASITFVPGKGIFPGNGET